MLLLRARVAAHTPSRLRRSRDGPCDETGGAIVIADTDWATLSIDAPDARVERALVRFVGETLCNGYAGRQLRRLMTSAGLAEVKVEMWPLVWTDYRLFRATSLSLLDMEARAVRAGSVSAGDLADLMERSPTRIGAESSSPAAPWSWRADEGARTDTRHR